MMRQTISLLIAHIYLVTLLDFQEVSRSSSQLVGSYPEKVLDTTGHFFGVNMYLLPFLLSCITLETNTFRCWGLRTVAFLSSLFKLLRSTLAP